MTTPIRLNVKREGHLTLHVGSVLIEVLVEGTLLVAAYQDGNSVPMLEYTTATGMAQPPEKTYPLPWLKPRPEPVVLPVPTPIPKPAKVTEPMVVPKPAATMKAASRNKAAMVEYKRIMGRKHDLSRMDLLQRLFVRACALSGQAFTPINPKAPFQPQKELFFAEFKTWWWDGGRRMKHINVKLGKNAPYGHTPHNYALSRLKTLTVPKTPEKLALRYAQYNEAMGTTHAIPGNMSLADAWHHLVEMVVTWHGVKERELQSRKSQDARAMRADYSQDLFGGNVRVTNSRPTS